MVSYSLFVFCTVAQEKGELHGKCSVAKRSPICIGCIDRNQSFILHSFICESCSGEHS